MTRHPFAAHDRAAFLLYLLQLHRRTADGSKYAANRQPPRSQRLRRLIAMA